MSEINRKVETLCNTSVMEQQQQQREVLFVFKNFIAFLKKKKTAYSNSIKQLSRVSHWESWFIKLFPAPEHWVVDMYPSSSMGIPCWYCISGISEEATLDIDFIPKDASKESFSLLTLGLLQPSSPRRVFSFVMDSGGIFSQ